MSILVQEPRRRSEGPKWDLSFREGDFEGASCVLDLQEDQGVPLDLRSLRACQRAARGLIRALQEGP